MALHAVIKAKNLDLFNKLVSGDNLQDKISQPSPRSHKTALYVAIKQGNMEMVTALIKAGANLNEGKNKSFPENPIRRPVTESPLHIAISTRNPEAVTLLADNGVEISSVNVTFAVLSKNQTIIQPLLNKLTDKQLGE